MSDNNSSIADQRKQRITGIFDRAAATYDHIGPRFFAHFGQALVDFAQIKPGSQVLDIATGRGALLFPAAQAVGVTGHVMGMDISHSMVEEARQEIRHRDLRNVEIQQMDAERLLFPDGSFDYVLCGFALFFFPHLEQALEEMRRVLQPGGCLVVSTWEKYEDECWSWFDPLVDTFLPPEPEKPVEPGSTSPPPELDTSESMEKVLSVAGFIDIQHKTERFEAIYQDRDEWWSAQWSHGARALLEMIEKNLGSPGLEHFKAVVFEELIKHQPAGGIRTNYPALYVKAIRPVAC